MSSQVLLSCVFLGLSSLVQSQPETSPSPIRLPPSISQSNGLATCPQLNFSTHRELVQQSIEDYNRVLPCSCGGTRGWIRAIYLNMSDMNQQCPNNLTLITTPIRGCGRKTINGGDCDSVKYQVHSYTYSKVCGRILAYQKGYTAAFLNSVSANRNGIEQAYLSGVSLTHGQPGSRQHIWSFAAGLYKQSHSSWINEQCPCTAPSYPYQVPPFINNDYFCDSGNSGPAYSSSTYYTDDPLWDGQGCGTGSTCCQFNNPPWFCTSLPQPTNEDLEIRNCVYYGHNSENSIISLIDIYVK